MSSRSPSSRPARRPRSALTRSGPAAAAPIAAPAARRRPRPRAGSDGQARSQEVSVSHRRTKTASFGAPFFLRIAKAFGVARAPPTRTIPEPEDPRPERSDRGDRLSGSSRRALLGEVRLDIFLQQVINGLTLGSVYAVVALGYTMVYGIIQLINFAHGEVVMIGAHGLVFGDHGARRARAGLPPLAIVIIGVLVRDPGCMARRLHAGAHRLPAAAQGASPRAADHRDRPVHHPAAPRDDRSGAATRSRSRRSSR